MFSILKMVFLGVSTAVFAPPVVGLSLIDQCWAYRLCQAWARLNLLAYGVDVRAERLAPLDAATAYVFMSNHRSHLDVLALISTLSEFQLRWVAKKELADIPIFGWALRQSGHIIVDRSDHRQAMESLRAAEAQTNAGISVIIFPEGTRAAPTDVLLPFKKGGFVLAAEAGLPIVPITVRGSGELLPKDSWDIASGEIEVVIGGPIAIDGASREALMAEVKAFMEEHLGVRAVPRRTPPAAAEAM